MNKLSRLLVFLLLIHLLACGDLRYGIPNSYFELSPDSRMPKWFEVPKGYRRENLDVQLAYYGMPFMQTRVIIKLKDKSSGKLLQEVIGVKRWHPITLKRFEEQGHYGGYPIYSIIKVDGIQEVFEKRQDGPILYITDDPKLIE